MNSSWWWMMNAIFAMVIVILLCALALRAYRYREMIPGPFQNGVEFVVESLDNVEAGARSIG